MKAVLRAMGPCGGALLAASFFIPASYPHSPYGVVARWTFGSPFLDKSFVDQAISAGVAFVVAYPYIWALSVAVTSRRLSPLKAGIGLWIQLCCHILGGAVIAVFGLLLLLSGDQYVPEAVQICAVCVPPVFWITLFVLLLSVKPAARVSAITIPGFLIHAVSQPVFAWKVYIDGGPPLGYVLGALGALLGLCGSICVFLLEVLSERSRHCNPDLQ